MGRRRLSIGILALGLTAAAEGRAAEAPAAARPDIMGRLSVPPRTITLFGQRIVYYEAGRGPALLLVPNLGWDSHAWSQNLPELARTHHVLALDLIGTGASDKPLIEYKMDTWTDFMAEFLRQKGIGKAAVVGAVMGGALAVQFALDHPDMTEAVVCAASNSGPGRHEGGWKGAPGPSLAGIRRSLEAHFHDKTLVTDDLVRARFEYRLRAGDGYTVQRHLADHREPYSPAELAGIRAPALFIWCREDAVTPLSWGEDFAAAVPGARLAVIDGCGHLPNLEKPGEFNRAVLEFLDEAPARTAPPARP